MESAATMRRPLARGHSTRPASGQGGEGLILEAILPKSPCSPAKMTRQPQSLHIRGEFPQAMAGQAEPLPLYSPRSGLNGKDMPE